MGSPVPKQFLPLGGVPIILHSFHLFAAMEEVGEIIVVCDVLYRRLLPDLSHPRVRFASPGERRQDSVWNALCLVGSTTQLVCIHDSARPLVTEAEVRSVLAAAALHQAAALALPTRNTIKQASSDGFVEATLDRNVLWEMYTPQVATLTLLQQGFQIASAKGMTVTDDVALVELTGQPVKLVRALSSNLKVTLPEDLTLAEALLSCSRSIRS